MKNSAEVIKAMKIYENDLICVGNIIDIMYIRLFLRLKNKCTILRKNTFSSIPKPCYVFSLFSLSNIKDIIGDNEGKSYYIIPYIRQSTFGKQNRWQEIENFQPSWERRTKAMIELITLKDYQCFLDFGCGEEKAKKYLNEGVSYVGIDYKMRNEETVLVDFNHDKFPNLDSILREKNRAVFFLSGLLEYIIDYEKFINELCNAACKYDSQIIISYCTVEHINSMRRRKELAWVNHLTLKQIMDLFGLNGFGCDECKIVYNNACLRFVKR